LFAKKEKESKNSFYESPGLVDPAKRARYLRADFHHEEKKGDCAGEVSTAFMF